MTNDLSSQWNDYNLMPAEIGELESFKHVVNLFAKLRYNVDGAQPTDHVALRLDTEDFRQAVRKLYRVGVDPEAGQLQIFLLEVRSVTQKLIQDIARRLRGVPEDYLLILTSDYEQLNFVLLERVLTESKTGSTSILRPRVLTVNRRNPQSVTLRVLKRFTFTEADADYQWEKLRGAYALAEWSEEYFNNRAMFSDYYLCERVTDPQITPAWAEDIRPVGREVAGLMAEARATFSGKPEKDVRAGLYERLFHLLGFEYMSAKTGSSSAEEPDYYLYTPGSNDKLIALALTYVWNRNLDDQDPNRDKETPTEIPGAMVVSVLERAEAPWVIVTNGKLWRLYSATASNKATNYYEVDLEEALADAGSKLDRVKAFKYWYLMFRQQAFTGFLDQVLAASADYAKKLGDSLKSTIFESIFPYFAAGFIEDMRAQSVAEEDIEANLELVFTSTLTFLYRLMFQLYAESLELLPVKELTGYGAFSLYRLKNEIAGRAEDSLDLVGKKLEKHYSAEKTEIYRDWLAWLFRLIDKGSADLNLPTYNGGLFSPSTAEGTFLEQYAIPDLYMALGMDALCRAIDDKTQGLAMIDFKSLGVRQLGSIYEGLLEFRLNIASEELAVIREKGKEVYLTAKEAKKEKKRVVYTLQPGEVYLINDKSERKATGSYYTPDFIVKHIVEHTVGPVLKRKFDELEPRLRDAQKRYRDHAKHAQAKGENPEKFWNSDDMRVLADDCLSVRVLDPAMGSGHFLVEVVDFVSNRLINFLNAWSENPVWALLDRTRADIEEEVTRQGVTVDFDRLTRVALLKRAVLKRCIYGVDLNPMAVELTKVSLWLDAFTLGAPLSFLDHHLKEGNSLIGASELGDVVVPGSKRWSMILEAATDMVRASQRSDATKADVDQSREDYLAAQSKLEAVKKYAHVSVGAFFVEKLNEYRQSKHHHRVIGQVAQIAYGAAADTETLDLYEKAQKVAEHSRFFHWKLEFPEVFIDLNTKSWTKSAGFDAVIGNPPYGLVTSKAEEAFVGDWSASHLTEAYILFIERGLTLTHKTGQFGMIVPNTWTQIFSAENFRRFLIAEHTIRQIVHTSKHVFSDAKVDTELLIVENSPPTNAEILISVWSAESSRDFTVPQEDWIRRDGDVLSVLFDETAAVIVPRLEAASIQLAEVFDVKNGAKPFEVGKGNPPQTKAITHDKPFVQESRVDKTFVPLLRGSLIDRYINLWDNDYWISYGPWLAAPRDPAIFFDAPEKVVVRQTGYELIGVKIDNSFVARDNLHIILPKDPRYALSYFLALYHSRVMSYYYSILNPEYGEALAQVKLAHLERLLIPKIKFETPRSERVSHFRNLTTSYETSQYTVLAGGAHGQLAKGRSDVIHDFLAYLAEQMIDLNKRKQAEVKRFLGWLESVLKIKPKSDGSKGIDSLIGKTYIQNYLGDYQKGQSERAWDDFYNDLWKNKNRFGVSLSDVKGQIEAEYAASLEVLLPIKAQLAATDELIDQIVYKLYGLTDEEIELIERPQYEQAISEAKADVLADKELSKPENVAAAFDYVAERIEAAAERLNTLSPSQAAEDSLDAAFPAWRSLSERAQTLLATAERDYLDETRPDYTGSEINYAKVVEATIKETLFDAFRAAGYTADDVVNTQAFKPFMSVGKKLTLGNFPFLFSRDERKFREFVRVNLYPDADTRIFGMGGIAGLLTMDQINSRNGSAHEDVVTRERAGAAREWALKILEFLC